MMNSRRLIGSALLRLEATHYHTTIAKALLLHHSKIDRRMAEMGQKRPRDAVRLGSALPRTADIDPQVRQVRLGPKADASSGHWHLSRRASSVHAASPNRAGTG